MADQSSEIRQLKPDKRINLFRILFVALFVIYSLRLFNMQILSGEQYRSQAQDISRRTEVIPFRRPHRP